MTVLDANDNGSYNPDIERALLGIIHGKEIANNDEWFNDIRSAPEFKLAYTIDSMCGNISSNNSMHVNIVSVIQSCRLCSEIAEFISSKFHYKITDPDNYTHIENIAVTKAISYTEDMVRAIKDLLDYVCFISKAKHTVLILNTCLYKVDILGAIIVAANNLGFIAMKYDQGDILFIKKGE